MSENKIIFSMQSEHELIESRTPTQRTVEVTIQPPAAPSIQTRPPLNLALVIDRSGSMSGEKLPYVQQASVQLLDLLDETDRVAVVAYDDEVTLVAESALLTPETRRRMKAAIQQIQPGGSTNLSGGWLNGCQQVAAHQANYKLNRALLMTDGQANAGIIEPEELRVEARNLNRLGVSTSTFGVGLGFNEHILEGMAQVGGGSFYFIEHPAQIPGIFAREFSDLASITARDVELTFEIPAGAALKVVGELDSEELPGGKLRLRLGALAAGQPKYVYLSLLTPPAGKAAELVLGGQLLARGENDEIIAARAEVIFRYASPEEVRARPVQGEMLARAAQVCMEDAVNQALKLERAGAGEKAASLLLLALETWRAHLSPADQQRYEQMARRMRHGMDELDRKTTHHLSYMKRTSRS